MRRVAPAAAAFALGALVAGCSQAGAHGIAPSGLAIRSGSHLPARPAASGERHLVAQAFAPGAVAARDIPAGRRQVAINVAFGGVVVERHAGWEKVLYPWLRLQVGRGASIAHLKLPFFRCPAGADPATTQPSDCRDRHVRYADATSNGIATLRERGGATVVRLVARIYAYGHEVDRARGLRARQVPGIVAIRATVRPGAVLQQTRTYLLWRPLATIEVSGQSGPPAPQDDGYDNTYLVATSA